MSKRKVFYSIITVVLLVTAILGYQYYQKVFGVSVTKSGFLYIKSDDTIEDLAHSLSDFIKDTDDFLWLAEKKKFSNIRAGKFEITEGLSNNDLINFLRSGKQTPVRVSFNNQDTLEKLAGRISKQIEADSLSLIKAFTDKKFFFVEGMNPNIMLGKFIPNTYEFFWNTSGKGFRERMFKESDRFWTKERRAKAKALGMTPDEAIALASIVQKETAQVSERPTVAGLYINRLKKGIPLQADPTVIYVLKQQKGPDYVVKRVLYKDLKIESPYNTYIHKGLPPSLIAMPDISSIDAVLNYQKHNYIYMCANIENPGFHAFASNLKQHNRNARKYQNWLNKKGVRR